jgi:hypothetical protein
MIAVSPDERAASEGSASTDRRSADPSTVRPAAGRGCGRKRRRDSPHAAGGRDGSVEASLGRVRVHRLWQPQASRSSDPRRPCPSCRARAATPRRTRPPRAGGGTSLPATTAPPRTEAEARALDWDQLKALVIAYPEIEYLPEAKWKRWLVSRWVGLTQAERDSFRAALDAATRRPSTASSSSGLPGALARSDIHLTRRPKAPIHK